MVLLWFPLMKSHINTAIAPECDAFFFQHGLHDFRLEVQYEMKGDRYPFSADQIPQEGTHLAPGGIVIGT